MRPIPFNPGVIFAASILSSLIFHWAAFTNVALIWPKLKETPKPMIVFLGSILQSSDTADRKGGDVAEAATVNTLTKIKDATQLYSGSVDKPWEQRASDPKSKRTLKNADALNAQAEVLPEPTALSVNEMEIDQTIEPYKPLRLKDND